METDAEMLEMADAVLPGAMNYSSPSKDNNGRRKGRNGPNSRYGGGYEGGPSGARLMMTKFTLYETKTKMYIVGSNTRETRFRMLEIDISDPRNKLPIQERFRAPCSRSGIIEKLAGLEEEHRLEGADGGLHKRLTAWGLLGFIKFTDIYYMCVITQRSVVAIIGGHYVYHIDATELVPMIHSSQYKRPDRHSEEARLLSTFQTLDLTKTFYFSQAYDLTNTLQYNLLREKVRAASYNVDRNEDLNKSEADAQEDHEHHVTFDVGHNARQQPNDPSSHPHLTSMPNSLQSLAARHNLNAGFEDGFNDRFVWNSHLLGLLRQEDALDWCVAVVHGFIDQARIAVKGRNITVTIIARRSRHFAGARFLKRGANNQGDVANEVETEQIVCDNLTTSFHDARSGVFCSPLYTSYVQHRGSIPLFWSQDVSNMSPKPPIELNAQDPFYTAAALHFNSLFERYGHPVLVLNLIKKKEHTPRETKLGAEFEECVRYLNQFLPESSRIKYTAWDMSRASKTRDQSVIEYLEQYAEETIQTTGIFHNGPVRTQQIQDGLCRTNCIDCLDRTNAAQFVIGKKALGYQLKALGITDTVNIDYDSDAVNLLTEMYHDHGDTIALQYGGSHLVNTMETYRKINQWTSHSRDLIESIRRFYSNSFVDSQRQDAINLFLGNYVWEAGRPQLWDLATDFYLHNEFHNISKIHRSYTHWWVPRTLHSLTERLASTDLVHLMDHDGPEAPLLAYPGFTDNWWNDCYFAKVYTSLHRMFLFNMNSTLRYISTPLNISPFISKRKAVTGTGFIEERNREKAKDRDIEKYNKKEDYKRCKSNQSIRHQAIKNASKLYLPSVPKWFSKNKDQTDEDESSRAILLKNLSKDVEDLENEIQRRLGGAVDKNENGETVSTPTSNKTNIYSTTSRSPTLSLEERQPRTLLPAYTSYFQGYNDTMFQTDRHTFRDMNEKVDFDFEFNNNNVDPDQLEVYEAFYSNRLEEHGALDHDKFVACTNEMFGTHEPFKDHVPTGIKDPDPSFYQRWLEI